MRLTTILRSPIFLLVIALAGCAMPERAPEPAQSMQMPEITENVWRQVDSDIVSGAGDACGPAKRFARSQMDQWRLLVAQRAEADFIPWFSSYWTQQWLTTKVAWYKLNAAEGGDSPVSRLAAYLQAQYYDRVLAPATREVDPASVTAQATKLYLQQLGEKMQPIPQRYGVPLDQFQRRLKSIPAIVLVPPSAPSASLFQIVYADSLDSLPAYTALLRQISEARGDAGAGLSKTRISPVARRVSEKLVDRLSVSGGTGAASVLIGGIAGTVISLGAAGVGMVLHESERKAVETQLRETLGVAMDDMWQILVENPGAGVTAGIDYLFEQIEKSRPQTFAQPVSLERPPQEIALPDEPQLRGESIDEAAQGNSGDRDR